MKVAHEQIGAPKTWRNDRFWIAGDHVVDPRVLDNAKVQALIKDSEQAKIDFKMTDYQGMNYTIMHTEFVRERAQPGMIVIGSDSHTCSGGAVGCLAISLGATDVMMPLVTGETWFKLPESILIRFQGKPAFGISGKDVILHILQCLKRNTVASDRILEFAGPGPKYLSTDARFAVCNMCTVGLSSDLNVTQTDNVQEFGAITGVFVPDEITQDYVAHRKRRKDRSECLYFRPDDGAVYADTFDIDLSKVEPTIAVYPSPDHVVPISEKADYHLDGAFIGACTTAEEEIILGGLVLQVGLKEKLPMKKGKRHMVPGSLPIKDKLQRLGILDYYRDAGFTIGVPGCSYCVGMSADQAGEGEHWLSSQNRNFKNRMGPGTYSTP